MTQKRGRPKKVNKATEVLPPIRVTKDQVCLYKNAASQAGVSLSAWLKQLADSEIERQGI